MSFSLILTTFQSSYFQKQMLSSKYLVVQTIETP